jgi:DNA-binding transcriptional ArsR family regulator
VDDIDKVLRAFAHHTRREILWLVWENPRNAGELAAHFDVAAPTVSQHLKVLLEADLIEVEAEGTFRRYRANRHALIRLRSWMPTARDVRVDGAISQTPAIELRAEEEVSCGVSEAFSAWSTPEGLSWLGKAVVVQPEPGGQLIFEAHDGARVVGVYKEVIAPRLMLIRWDVAGVGVPLPPGANLTMARFVPLADDRTAVRVVQWVYEPDLAGAFSALWLGALPRMREMLEGVR